MRLSTIPVADLISGFVKERFVKKSKRSKDR